jgi:hypothetical protein
MRRYPPTWVVPRHLQDQGAYRLRRGRPSRSAPWVCPLPTNQVGVPSQQGSRGDDQAQLVKMAARQQPTQCGQDCPVGPGQPRCPGLALEHGDLMAQDEVSRRRESHPPPLAEPWPQGGAPVALDPPDGCPSAAGLA